MCLLFKWHNLFCCGSHSRSPTPWHFVWQKGNVGTLVAQSCGSEQPLTVSGLGLVSWKFPQGSDKATPLPGSQLRHPAAEHCRGHTGATKQPFTLQGSFRFPSTSAPKLKSGSVLRVLGWEGERKGEHKAFPGLSCSIRGPRGGAGCRCQRPLAAAAPAVSRDLARRARGAGALLGGEAPSCSCAGRRGRAGPALRERSGQRPPPPRRAAWTPTITAGSSQVGARGAGPSGEGVGHGRACGLEGTAAGPWPEGSPALIASIVRCRAVRQSLSGFLCSRGWWWFVRTALFSCPVRAGARPAPVRFL